MLLINDLGHLVTNTSILANQLTMVTSLSRKVTDEPLWINITPKGATPSTDSWTPAHQDWRGQIPGTLALETPTCPASSSFCALIKLFNVPGKFSLDSTCYPPELSKQSPFLQPGFRLGGNSPSGRTHFLSRQFPVKINLFLRSSSRRLWICSMS